MSLRMTSTQKQALRDQWYGRGELTLLTPEETEFARAIAKVLSEWPVFKPGFLLPKRLEDFRRNRLADAVASVVRP